GNVTGVQTCALPILTLTRLALGNDLVNEKFARVRSNCDVSSWGSAADAPCPDRLGDRRGRRGPTEHAGPGEAGGCLERRADLSFRGHGGTAHGTGGGGGRAGGLRGGRGRGGAGAGGARGRLRGVRAEMPLSVHGHVPASAAARGRPRAGGRAAAGLGRARGRGRRGPLRSGR